MRGKKAKLLRRKARELSKGMSERRLLAQKHTRTVIIDGKNEKYQALQVFNDPKTTRGTYLNLKRGQAA